MFLGFRYGVVSLAVDQLPLRDYCAFRSPILSFICSYDCPDDDLNFDRILRLGCDSEDSPFIIPIELKRGETESSKFFICYVVVENA